MRMQEDEAASGVGCLLDGPSHQRPCTGAYPAIDDMGKTFDVWHHANADDGYNTSVSEADPGSLGTDADDMKSVLVSWHDAPLDMPDDHRSPPVTPPIASGGEVLSSEESFLHTPPSPRTGSPEIPLECGSRGHTSDAGGHLGVLPMDSRPSGAASADRHVEGVDVPARGTYIDALQVSALGNYCRANLARQDAMPTTATSLLLYTNFPGVCTDAFATLTPQL